MEQRFARRFDGITGSAIRDIFKLLGKPGMISFAGGNPAAFALEEDILADISRDVLLRDGKSILQYGATEGWIPYREQTTIYLREEAGIDVCEQNVLPTTGSTQAIDLLLKAMIDEGDTVLVEGPSFLGTLQAMKLYGAHLVPVQMDHEGLDMNALEQAIEEHRPKLLYTVPNFQNPTGVTMAEKRRKQIVALAEQYDFFIAEDDPYRGLRYQGEALPTIFSFDGSDRVVYLTSFSKLISPGLRVGAAVTRNEALMRKLTIGKQSTDCHTPNLTQAIVAEYLSRGLLPEHIRGICVRYKQQLAHMLDALKTFPKGVKSTQPEGGLFVWVDLPEACDAVALLQKAVAKGVAYVPGTHFYAQGGHLNTMRLNFSNSETERIVQGMEILKQCILQEGF